MRELTNQGLQLINKTSRAGPVSIGVLIFTCWLTKNAAWISNYVHYRVWDEIIFPFPNFNGCTVEVWEWISNFIPRFSGHVITYPN